MTREANEGRFGLVWAAVASVVVHLLLLLLSGWLPLAGTAVEATPPDTPIRLTFAPVVNPEAEPQVSGGIPIPQTPPPSAPAPQEDPIPPAPAIPEPAPAPETAEPEPEEEEPDPEETPEQETVVEEPDIRTRLRQFREAVTTPPSPEERAEAEARRGGGTVSPPLPPLPATGFGFGNLEFESRDFDWSEYARAIYVAIWRAWHNRMHMTTDVFERWAHRNGSAILEHQNRIRFTILASGNITDVVVETPSGCVPLDDSASDALREVVLPPLPADFPRDQEVVHARFIAEGDIRSMRTTLQYLKRLGLF